MTTRTRAEGFLLGATIIWSGTFALVKDALGSISPLLFVGIRFSIAAIVLVIIFFRSIRNINRRAFFDGLVLGILLGFGFTTQTVGLQYTMASKSGFITGMTVVFTPLFQMVIERRMPRAGNVAGVVLVLIGLWFLTSPKGQTFNFGDALTLIAAVVFALYMVFLDVFSKRNDILHLTFLQIAATAFLALVGSVIVENVRLEPTIGLFGTFLYTVFFATLLTTYLQTRFQRDTTPTRAALIFSLEPVLAAVISWWVLGEVIGSQGILGAMFIVIGILGSELSR